MIQEPKNYVINSDPKAAKLRWGLMVRNQGNGSLGILREIRGLLGGVVVVGMDDSEEFISWDDLYVPLAGSVLDIEIGPSSGQRPISPMTLAFAELRRATASTMDVEHHENADAEKFVGIGSDSAAEARIGMPVRDGSDTVGIIVGFFPHVFRVITADGDLDTWMQDSCELPQQDSICDQLCLGYSRNVEVVEASEKAVQQ